MHYIHIYQSERGMIREEYLEVTINEEVSVRKS